MNKHAKRLLPVVNKLISTIVSQNNKRLEVAALQQFIENSIDAGATEIRILIEHGKHLRVVDNGRGLDEVNLSRLNTFMDEEGAKDPLQNIGKHNAGRIAGLGCAENLEFYSSAEGGRVLFETGLTREKIAHMIGDPETYQNKPTPLDKLPDWWKPSYLSTVGTGTAVEMQGVKWDGLRTVTAKGHDGLKAALSEILGPWIARKVFFNDEKDPLPPMYVDEPFSGEEMDPDLGKIQWLLYRLPQAKRRAKDVIRIGGEDPLMTLKKFLEASKSTLPFAAKIPEWMGDNDLAGFLNFATVNAYAAHDRNNVEEELFRDHQETLIKILNKIEMIGKAAEAKYGFAKKKGKGPRGELKDIANEMFERVTVNVEPPGPPASTQPEVILTAGREVVPGDKVEIEVRKGGKGGTWTIPPGMVHGEVAEHAGGLKISFVASEKIGTYKVTYVSKKGAKAHCGINIVSERKMRIDPGLVTAPPYDHEIVLENCDADPTDIEWSFKQVPANIAHFLKITPSAEAKTAAIMIDSRCPNGVYQVAAKLKNGKEATTNVWVKKENAHDVVDPDLYWIAGHLLQLQEGMDKDPTVTVRLRSRLQSVDESTTKEVQGTITVNPKAPQFQNHPPEVAKQLIAHRMVLEVVSEVARSKMEQAEGKDAISGLVQDFDKNTDPTAKTKKRK